VTFGPLRAASPSGESPVEGGAIVRRFGALIAIMAGLALAGCQAAQPSIGPSRSTEPSASPAASGPTSTPSAFASASAPSTSPSSAASLGPGRWTDAGTLTAGYVRMQGVTLADGRVLVVGTAYRADVEVPVADLWDPATGRWSATQALPAYRDQFALVALRDGRALVAGGANANGTSFSSAYVFDPAPGSWAKVGLLATARSGPSAGLLPDGRVLVAGGFYRNNGSSSVGPDVVLAAYDTTSADAGPRLADVDVPPSGYALATAEIFDPASGSWSSAGPLRYARTGAPATVLSDGRILVVGSADYNVNRLDGRAFTTAEVYDPAADQFTLTRGLPELDRAALERGGAKGANPIPPEDPQPGSAGSLVAVPGGDAVLIGVAGWWKHVGDVSRSFRYDTTARRWSEIGQTFISVGEPGPIPLYHEGVPNHATAAVAGLPAGRVLVAGGSGPFQRLKEGGYDTPMTAEVVAYDAAANAWPTLSPLPEAREGSEALSLSDGSVLVFGGIRRTPDEVTGIMTAVRFLPGD
jgi:N-acetylneuraminic acid mutarotase